MISGAYAPFGTGAGGTPGGFERYFEEMAPVLLAHGDEAAGRFYELAEQYGIEIMDDWVAELESKHAVKL